MKFYLFLKFIAGCLVMLTVAYAQIPPWEDVVELNFNATEQLEDVEAHGGGIHAVVRTTVGNSNIIYYHVDSDGNVRSTTLIDQGFNPCIAAFQNNVYVLYYHFTDGKIKGKYRSFDGQNWTPWTSIEDINAPGEPTQTDAVMDERGVHLVWSTTSEYVYYSLYDDDPKTWTIVKSQVSNWGTAPTVTTSADRAHVGFLYLQPQIPPPTTRDYDFAAGWLPPQVVDANAPDGYISINLIVKGDDLHAIYKPVEEDLGQYFIDVAHKKRSITGSWSPNPGTILLEDYTYYEFERLLTKDNQALHLTYAEGIYLDAVLYREYSDVTGWGAQQTVSPFMQDYYRGATISNNQTGVLVIWKEIELTGDDDYHTFFRRKPKAIFADVTEHSLWTGNVWIGDTQQPREVINIPAGVTVTLDDNATLYLQGNWINVYGTFHFDPANVIFDGGEIFIYNDGIAYNNGTGSATIYGQGSCITVKEGGRFITSNPGYQLSFADGAVFFNNGGSVELSDNSKMIFDATSQKLKITSGSTIKLGDNAEIIARSELDIQGTAAYPITFTSLYPSPSSGQYWKWLKLDGSQDGDPPPQRIFDNVIIEYADYGIHATQVSNLAIDNSTLQNCRVNNIYLYSSYADLDNNQIRNSGISNGVYLYNSSPVFYNSAINDNTGAGVFCYNYSSPEFGASTSTAYGFNVLAGNVYGVSAVYYSNPFLGDEYDMEGPVRYGGYNSIYDNSSAAVKAMQYCDVNAQYNWWGGYPVDPRIFDIEEDNSSIDYSHALTFDPNQESSALTGGGSIAERSGSSLLPTENFTPRQLLKLAKKLRVQRAPRLALPVYKQLILNYPNRVEARWGLIELVSTFKEAGRDSAVAYLLHTIAAHPNLQMQQAAYDMLTGEYLEKRNASVAVANAQQVLANYPNTESGKTALFDLVNIYLHNLNDLAQAQSYLSQLESKYPGDELTFHAQMLLGSGGGSFAKNQPARPGMLAGNGTNSSGELSETAIEAELPETFMLFQNYPNPFNPTTNIRFGLPEPAEAELAVYSLNGQKVATLVREFLEAGYHTVEWNGRNASGNTVASGIYIYQLKVGNQQLIRKMVLIK